MHPSVTNHNAYTSAGEYRKAYPEAKLIGVEPLIEKKKAEGLVFDGGEFIQVTADDVLSTSEQAYGFDPPETQYGFEEEVSPPICFRFGEYPKSFYF